MIFGIWPALLPWEETHLEQAAQTTKEMANVLLLL